MQRSDESKPKNFYTRREERRMPICPECNEDSEFSAVTQWRSQCLNCNSLVEAKKIKDQETEYYEDESGTDDDQ